jgi:hypothetical protein
MCYLVPRDFKDVARNKVSPEGFIEESDTY